MNISQYKRVRGVAAMAAMAALTMTGCEPDNPDAPPELRVGDSTCAECNMIISDERFATATVVSDERDRPETLLFDDFNCQVNHAEAHSEEYPVLRRWVRDHGTKEWLDLDDAYFVHADNLRTPMASHGAAFSDKQRAEEFAEQLQGEVVEYEKLRLRMLGRHCCSSDGDEE